MIRRVTHNPHAPVGYRSSHKLARLLLLMGLLRLLPSNVSPRHLHLAGVLLLQLLHAWSLQLTVPVRLLLSRPLHVLHLGATL